MKDEYGQLFDTFENNLTFSLVLIVDEMQKTRWVMPSVWKELVGNVLSTFE